MMQSFGVISMGLLGAAAAAVVFYLLGWLVDWRSVVAGGAIVAAGAVAMFVGAVLATEHG